VLTVHVISTYTYIIKLCVTWKRLDIIITVEINFIIHDVIRNDCECFKYVVVPTHLIAINGFDPPELVIYRTIY